MKCISCEIDINPQWKHAIDINVCPFCGKHIMEEHLKNLFSSLRATMDQLLAYPDQLNDWMISNHNYIKTDSPNLMGYLPKEAFKELRKAEIDKESKEKKDNKFTVKVKLADGEEEEVVAEKIQSDEKTLDFHRRAETIRPKIDGFNSTAEKNDHLKKVVAQIKKHGAASVNDTGLSGFISPEMIESADPEAVAAFQAEMSGGEISSSISDGIDDGDDVPSFIINANNAIAAGRGNNGSSNAKDLMMLKNFQSKVNDSRKNFESGENRGKGGFSRS